MRKVAVFLSQAGLALISQGRLRSALRARRAFVLTTAALTFLSPVGTAFAQKKPITLDALQAWRNNAARSTPGDPVWAPDGKTFVFTARGASLKWFDVAAKKSHDVLDLITLDNAALSPPAPERFEWENRRVDEADLTVVTAGPRSSLRRRR